MFSFVVVLLQDEFDTYRTYHVLSDKDIGSILFISNESKKSIWYVFWINPKLIRYVEKEA